MNRLNEFLFATRGEGSSWKNKCKLFLGRKKKMQKNGKYQINVCHLLKCHRAALPTIVSVAFIALEQLLTELEDFLRILDKENLSSTALVKKSFLSDLLRVYTKSSGTGRAWGQRALVGTAVGSRCSILLEVGRDGRHEI